MDLTPGEVLDGKYKIGALLGRGGMGAVYAGENVRIRRMVAIKVLHQGAAALSDALMRFEREAQAAGQIGSDHIAEVLDLGVTPNGDRYMVMEFLDGESLQARILRGRMKPTEIVRLIRQLLDGLGAAHKAGIIHRDLKPDNVFILKEKARRKDFVKILDFGISKFSALSGEEGAPATRAGTVMGTPFYMSPEQAKSANEVDARSDLYSVGVVLYQAVTGQVPFKAKTFAELLFKIVFDNPPLPQTVEPTLGVNIVHIITKAMARAPADRYQSADEFDAALAQWEQTDDSIVAALPDPSMAQALPLPGGSTVALDSGSFSAQSIDPSTVALSQATPSRPSGELAAPSVSVQTAPPHPVPREGASTGSSWGGGGTGGVERPPAPKRTGLLVAIAALAIAIGGLAVILMVRGGKSGDATVDSAKQTAATPASAPAPQPTIQSAAVAPVATAAPQAMPPADTAVAAAIAASANATAKPGGGSAITGRHGAAPPPVAAAPAAPSATPKAAAPAGKAAVSDFGY